LVVGPLVARLGDDGGVGRWHLGLEGERVGFLPPLAVLAEDVVAVPAADLDAGDEDLPDAGGAERAHRVGAGLPVVEVAGDLHAAGVGRPDGEGDTLDRTARGVVAPDVRAEHLPQPLVPALADQVLVELADRGHPAVRVVDGVGVRAARAVAVGDLDAVVARLLGQRRLVDAAAVQLPALVARAVLVDHRDADRVRPQGAHDPAAVAHRVRAEHGVRVVRPALDDGPQVVAADPRADAAGGGGGRVVAVGSAAFFVARLAGVAFFAAVAFAAVAL